MPSSETRRHFQGISGRRPVPRASGVMTHSPAFIYCFHQAHAVSPWPFWYEIFRDRPAPSVLVWQFGRASPCDGGEGGGRVIGVWWRQVRLARHAAFVGGEQLSGSGEFKPRVTHSRWYYWDVRNDDVPCRDAGSNGYHGQPQLYSYIVYFIWSTPYEVLRTRSPFSAREAHGAWNHISISPRNFRVSSFYGERQGEIGSG